MKNGTAAKNRVTPIDAQLGRLPPQPTGLIGRAEELGTAQGQVLAPDVRLLTLIGPGGVGKTRLAVAVADSMRANPAFSDVRFVDLAPLPEPTLVPSAIARGLGAPQAEDGNAIKALGEYLGQQRMLVVLDNFEHLLPAAADVGDLLAECPGLVVLATSREPLHLRWERTLPLGPLAVPDPKHLPALDRLAAVPAVTLFLERARAADPGFMLAAHNAAAVAELCVRLDGLPLAIELVAARAAQLGPAVVLERIARRLPLPASTMHDAPARQQTLRATLQWSVDLLDAAEQTLFRRVAAFAGGWTLDAAEAVGAWRCGRHGRRARHPDGTHIAGRQEPRSRSSPGGWERVRRAQVPHARDRTRVRARHAGGERRSRLSPPPSRGVLRRHSPSRRLRDCKDLSNRQLQLSWSASRTTSGKRCVGRSSATTRRRWTSACGWRERSAGSGSCGATRPKRATGLTHCSARQRARHPPCGPEH